MPEKRVEELVRSAVAQVLERQMSSLRETVVQEVLREVGPALTGKSAQPANSIAALQKAVATVQAGSTQKEILRALLENTILYSGRAALFVVKGGSATGWQAVAFGNGDVKDFPLDISSGLATSALQSHSLAVGSVSEFDQAFLSKFGKPHGKEAVVLPLMFKDKVSALVYADEGSGSSLDSAALDVLVRATSAWLEVIAQRKQAHKDGTSEPHEVAQSASANDPFAAHAPIHSSSQPVTEAAPAAMSAAAGWGGSVTVPTGEDADLHRKAQRFARLLIDEIKLYNQTKVAEGRKHHDLYDRLKEDVEKSRATYQKRYGHSSAAAADYFNQELIRSLAEDDVSLLGNNFRR